MKRINRRDFIGSSGAIGALTLGSSTIASTLSAGERINVAVIGVGARGSDHLRALNEIKGFNLVAVCDVRGARRDFARSFGSRIDAYDDYRRVLDRHDVDAVTIATPLDRHYPMAKAAIEAGKHVLCEKTMTYGIDQALDLVERADRSQKTFMVGYQYPFHTVYDQVRGLIDQNTIGRIVNIECQWNRMGDWRHPAQRDQERLVNWRMYRQYSKGLLAELGSHHLDFVDSLAGSAPKRVTGFGSIDYWQDGRETYDNVELIYQYPTFKMSFTSLTANDFGGYSIKIKGDGGTIVCTQNNAYLIGQDQDGGVDGFTGATRVAPHCQGREIVAENRNATEQAFKHFYQCVVESKTPISDVRAGARGAISVSLGVKAMMEGQVQTWLPNYDV